MPLAAAAARVDLGKGAVDVASSHGARTADRCGWAILVWLHVLRRLLLAFSFQRRLCGRRKACAARDVRAPRAPFSSSRENVAQERARPKRLVIQSFHRRGSQWSQNVGFKAGAASLQPWVFTHARGPRHARRQVRAHEGLARIPRFRTVSSRARCPRFSAPWCDTTCIRLRI